MFYKNNLNYPLSILNIISNYYYLFFYRLLGQTVISDPRALGLVALPDPSHLGLPVMPGPRAFG
jgi:hypothetical protein